MIATGGWWFELFVVTTSTLGAVAKFAQVVNIFFQYAFLFLTLEAS
jgi:hypothetical protein